ncbi:LytTR family transcriptional regulator DNA-binding domain-containing protein [Gemella sp.]
MSEIEHLHNNFFCCHRSYIVNLESIIDSKKDIVIFKNNISLLLTDKSTKKIRKSLKNIVFTSH